MFLFVSKRLQAPALALLGIAAFQLSGLAAASAEVRRPAGAVHVMLIQKASANRRTQVVTGSSRVAQDRRWIAATDGHLADGPRGD